MGFVAIKILMFFFYFCIFAPQFEALGMIQQISASALLSFIITSSDSAMISSV